MSTRFDTFKRSANASSNVEVHPLRVRDDAEQKGEHEHGQIEELEALEQHQPAIERIGMRRNEHSYRDEAISRYERDQRSRAS